MISKFQEEKSERKLEQLRRREEEGSVRILSEKYRIPYADLSTVPVEVDAVGIVAEADARAAELAVLQAVGKHLKIAVRNPDKEPTKAALARLSKDGYRFDLFLVSLHSLAHAWEYYRKIPRREVVESGTIPIHAQALEALRAEFKDLTEVPERIASLPPTATTQSLEIILAGALIAEASDVHLEPQKETVRLRFRLDGVLHDVAALTPKLFALLLSRIKLIAELKLNIHDRAQDGRFTMRVEEGDVEVRVSTLPGPYGENVVLRILNPKTIAVRFEELGMQPVVLDQMQIELKRPNGMIVTTGPTGSGKTTTLYAFLRKIHTPDIKIITIEDPIEYHLTGIEQTQVDRERGYDFVNGLRSIVRQDPDVILVGEIRDLETADTAVNAALTGHLVFTTLHTNNAAGTIPRLLTLGVKPAIIAPAINVSMAQRLVRKLCATCRTPVTLSTDERKRIEAELTAFPKDVKRPDPKDWRVFRPNGGGCGTCHKMGYRGRIGVFEIIRIDEAVEALILKEPTEYQIKKEALHQGQLTMRQDGVLKVLNGVTDWAELERVIGT